MLAMITAKTASTNSTSVDKVDTMICGDRGGHHDGCAHRVVRAAHRVVHAAHRVGRAVNSVLHTEVAVHLLLDTLVAVSISVSVVKK